MAYSWASKIVVITGAATGIGAAIVRQLMEEGVSNVLILDVDAKAGVPLQAELNSKYGKGKVVFYQCDVSDDDGFRKLFDTIKKQYGNIDVVINNAGIMNDRLNVYKKAIDVNVTALCTGTLKGIEHMRKDKGGFGGTVINISSIAGISQSPLLPIYFATKSAVLQFSNCIGMDEYYSKTKVRVLAICFGATSTPLLTKEKLGSFDPEFEDEMLRILKGYTYQNPEDAARGVIEAFKEAKSGTTWLINAGESALDISDDIGKAFGIMSSKII
ncbi:15-hydroxyprostaglandin dehydrogenase [NAD(+)]-like [Anticarsia gemmatalis]|uniref:15-hydroxyprostaglandin dehydrogenase [NAD(+)]-like n=1 Tax=Anticarsia gemmatalis TaxID=129554 RepID=UPI003F75D76A